MTKEELENRKLERRAKEWLIKDKGGSIIQSLVNLIKEFTEPREKRIAELETQIEKMKCCENCNNFMHRIDHRCNTKCKNLSEWEIKEK